MGANQTTKLIPGLPDLLYVSDDGPGWTRRRCGRGFSYLREDGSTIKDEATKRRLRALVIPPAWEDVWICPLPNGHLLSTGRDEAGRKQYRYHPKWLAYQQNSKFNHLMEFAAALPEARVKLRGILQDKSRGWTRRRAAALATALMDETGMRVGNAAYQRKHGTVGLTTLRRKHIEADGEGLHFEYTGKSGIEREVDLEDPLLIKFVNEVNELPGYELFRFRNAEGKMENLDSSDINALVKEVIGEEFSSKFFRTWAGTAAAVRAYWECCTENGGAPPERVDLRVVERVAEFLGNTVSVCRKYYIHPSVLAHIEEGKVPPAESIGEKELARFAGEFDAEEIIAFRLAHA